MTPTPTALSETAVWVALARIPDPEIPVISLVDLGVVTAVEVSDGAVGVELTPTFLGCPALEAMTRAIETELEALGAEADVRVRTDREWVDCCVPFAGLSCPDDTSLDRPP